MSTIIVKDLNPIGLDLVADQESYLIGLQDHLDELGGVRGGGTPLSLLFIAGLGISAVGSYVYGKYYS